MNEHSNVRIESPAFSSDTVHLLDLTGREAISQLFEFHAQVASSDPAGLDVDALIGSPAILVFERGGVETRRLGGLVAGIRDSMHEETGKMVYDLWFAPRAFRLGLVETYEIFMDLSVPDIVKKKLERAGLLENQDYELRLTATYAPREFVVQYQETDLAFVSRLLEHVGVCFFFEHKEGVDLLVLSDKNSGFAPPVDGKEVPFRSRGERQGVFAIESQTRMTPAQYVVKDYNYRTPQLALQATAPNDKGDGGFVMEYGAHFKNPDEGAIVAKIRAEELAASRTIFEGKSDRHGFSAGAMVLLESHPRGDLELLLTEVHHRASTSALGTGKEHARDYENTFKAIPGKTPYRPARITPKPRIHGVITGVIDAAAKGPYAELDADGRYRVRFLFDAGEAGDGQASRLCRMAQPHGGGGFGMHFPLRSGVEVILTFVEGDPDRPIILGVVPNPQTPSPVTGGNGTRNVIRTGGGNEINIDDTAGAERIKMSTPFGNSVIQIGEKNAPEQGIAQLTDEHMSSKSMKSINFETKMSTAVSDVCRILSAKDLTQYCTPFMNMVAFASAIFGGAGTAAEALKSMLGSSDEIQGLNSFAEEKEKEARQAKKTAEQEREKTKAEREELEKQKEQSEAELQRLQAELGNKQAQLAKDKSDLAAKKKAREAEQTTLATTRTDSSAARLGALNDDIAALETKIEAEEAAIARLESEVAAKKEAVAATQGKLDALDASAKKADTHAETLEDQAETAKRMADDIKSQFEETTAGKVSAYVDDYVKTLGGPLMSTVGDAAGFFAQNAADIHADQLVGFAETVAMYGRMATPLPLVTGSPKFVGGGTMNAALLGGVSVFSGANMYGTLYAGHSAAVLSKNDVTVKGVFAELSGVKKVWVTSKDVIDIESSNVVRLEAIANRLEGRAGTDIVLIAKKMLDAKATKGMIFASEEGSIKMSFAKDTSLLELAKDHLQLFHGKDRGMTVDDKSGAFVYDQSGCYLEPESVVLTNGKADLKFKGGDMTLKGSGALTMDSTGDMNVKAANAIVDVSGNVLLDGSKILLG